MGFDPNSVQSALDRTTTVDEALNILLDSNDSKEDNNEVSSHTNNHNSHAHTSTGSQANAFPISNTDSNFIQLPISQYDIGGNSSCTMIACNFINQSLPKIEYGLTDIEDINYLNAILMNGNQMYQRVQTESDSNSGRGLEHMSIDECI